MSTESDIPKPVAPAAAIPTTPAHALGPLTETQPGFLAQAKETILPIVEKVQTTTKPYTDAAAERANQWVDKMEVRLGLGNVPPTGASTERSAEVPQTTTAGTANTGDMAANAKGMFQQVSGAVTNAFTQVTNTIETRTTTESHPGLITQVQNAVANGQKKFDAFLDQPVGQQTGGATAEHPVMTTTNAVPHSNAAETQAVPAVPVVPAVAVPAAGGVPGEAVVVNVPAKTL